MEFIGTLKDSPQGKYTSLREAGLKTNPLERDEAYLDFRVHRDHTLFEMGRKYFFELYFIAMYPSTPEKSDKNFKEIKSNSIERMVESEEFKKQNLSIKNIVPYVRILQKVD